MKKAICTICTGDHLYKTWTLRDAILRYDETVTLHVLVVDTPKYLLLTTKSIEYYNLSEINGIAGFDEIVKQYREESDALRWSLKPIFLQYLLKTRAVDALIYLDNDIYFFNDFGFLWQRVAESAIVLSPHWRSTNPSADAINFENNFLDGVYNGGFIGASSKGIAALKWWADACIYACTKSSQRGLFVDQKYLDLMQSRFENISVLRHKGCNIADWNQVDCVRTLTQEGRVLIANQYEVIFIHFTLSTLQAIHLNVDKLLKPHLDIYLKNLRKYRPEFEIEKVSLPHISFVQRLQIGIKDLKTHWKNIGELLKNSLKKSIGFLKKMASVLVNYAIYYFRVWILREDKKTARREHYESYMEAKNRKPKKRIAIVNKNFNKYTETFIQRHRSELPFDISFFYGGYFPDQEEQEGTLLPKKIWQRTLLIFFEQFLQQGENFYVKKAFKQALEKRKIEVVLAEFGICGASITPICRRLNIPLLVVFYGYDAFHADVLRTFRDEYQQMFQYAACLIGVSKDIVQQLIQLGASPEKVVYLPCALDLNRFAYTDHSENPLIFLVVGRFAETKSPHLTILAFEKVLTHLPHARLVMVGKGGGGELFEACLILAKALKIEKSIEFKGVLSHDQVYEEMKKARVFVQHSLTTPENGDKEGTPVAIMEAMACGLPVVATRHAGIAEMIENEKTGILIEEYDIEGMAKAMIRVATDQRLAIEMGRNASISIRHNPLVEKHISLLTDLIELHSGLK